MMLIEKADDADMRMHDDGLIYAELTYQLNGVCFAVQNVLGRNCSEKQYADAIEKYLIEKELSFSREYVLPPMFEGEQPGRHRVDFFIDGRVVLELKAKKMIERVDYDQLLRYLNVLNCKLGLLVNFRERNLKPRRVLNSRAPVIISAYPHHRHL
ncbi:MAG: GxxExxY protein [Candidatus Uhrbacteria bacterium]